jgi:hypothetical protein
MDLLSNKEIRRAWFVPPSQTLLVLVMLIEEFPN